ncbi:aspartyl-phosphate phosphatase Spo0E family protein [Clostridium sp.]|uniref:aspartyl-phosphate phosphatase Spo0E family protein n=1 Tax=Clostridium sp. TaxID=1506 RepID=UPI0026195791|nr:aspartyl-phosphate phosphatase Spo0E family protein [Clostridium sp.]
MVNILKQIEDTRVKLNSLISHKEIITNDAELLELSIELDNLISQYYIHVNKKPL